MSRLEIRIREQDKEIIQRRAKHLGLSVSEFVRQMALNGFAMQYRVEVFYDLFKAIMRIGTNINQIARVCNETRSVHWSDVRDLRIEQSRLLSLLTNMLVLDEDRAKLIEIVRFKVVNKDEGDFGEDEDKYRLKINQS